MTEVATVSPHTPCMALPAVPRTDRTVSLMGSGMLPWTIQWGLASILCGVALWSSP
jgi:hypothetical protein